MHLYMDFSSLASERYFFDDKSAACFRNTFNEDAPPGDFADDGDNWGFGAGKWVGPNTAHGMDELGEVN